MRDDVDLEYKAVNYREIISLPCCHTCGNRRYEDGNARCALIEMVVSEFGLCDKYELPF